MPQMRPVTPAYLPDHALSFSVASGNRRGGVLDIVPRRGHVVGGTLFEVDDADWDALDRKEGAPKFYERVTRNVIDKHGRWIEADTYAVVASRRELYVQPHPDYVKLVAAGRKQFSLCTDGLLAAARNEQPTSAVDSLFVYGTLMRGECRFSAIRRHQPECILLAATFGRLLNTGSFPGMVISDHERAMVQGEFIRFDAARLAEALSDLDLIEGFDGFNETNPLFRRTLISCDVGDGRIRQAWTYVWAGASDEYATIPSGDWRAHRGCRDRFLRQLAEAHAGKASANIAAELACRIPFCFNGDLDATTASLLPLSSALQRGDLSERRLCQHSGKWAAVP